MNFVVDVPTAEPPLSQVRVSTNHDIASNKNLMVDTLVYHALFLNIEAKTYG
jgi:hypothetical protein